MLRFLTSRWAFAILIVLAALAWIVFGGAPQPSGHLPTIGTATRSP